MPAWSGVLRRGTAEARVEALCDHSAGTHAIEVRMRGLTPGEVYSFWLVTHDGARGLGPPPHQLRALADGTLRLEATLDTCPLTFELHLRVYAHPAAGGRQLVVDGYVAER